MWVIFLQLDIDQADVGSFNATWTDPNAALGIFVFSKRIKVIYSEINATVRIAIAERDAWQIRRQTEIEDSDWILEVINQVDPKGVK